MNPPALADAPFGTLSDLIRGYAARQPSHPALVHDGRTVTYSQLDALLDRVAAALQREGLAPRDAIAICATTSIEYAAVYMGALRAGVVVAPLAPSCTAEELAGMAADAGVPTVGESLPGYSSRGWFGFLAPRGTPRTVVARGARKPNHPREL